MTDDGYRGHMPVMVMGVDNAIGRSAVHLLRSRGGEVRVFVQAADPTNPHATIGLADPEEFRALGCKVAHGFLDDEGHVETALEQVHTVLLLLGRPTDDPAVYLDRAATVISAAIGAGCRRMVVLSDLAAADPRGNPWLEALAEVEEMAADAPLESVILRAALVYGSGDVLTAAIAGGGVGAFPTGAHWVVNADDVAVTAVLADAERDLDPDLHVVVSVTGPQKVPLATLVERLASVVSVTTVDPLPSAALELLGRTIDRPDEAVGDGGRLLQEFGT